MSIVESAVERAKVAAVPQPAHARYPAPVVWSRDQQHTAVDFERLQQRKLYPPPEFVNRLKSEYRSLRREVIAACQHLSGGVQSGTLICVSSALPGDGKSYTALNLALSLVREGVHDVLLIDADTVKRSITTALELQDRPGLLQLLSRPAAGFLDNVVATDVERLHVLPAGMPVEGGSDLFSSGRVGPLCEAIRSAMSGHFVVIDTPPLLLSSDTPVLTDCATLVLLVVRAGITLRDSLTEAVSLVRNRDKIRIVLNAWSPRAAAERKAYVGFQEYAQ